MNDKLKKAQEIAAKAKAIFDAIAEKDRKQEHHVAYQKAMDEATKLINEDDAEVKAATSDREDSIKSRLDSAIKVEKPGDPPVDKPESGTKSNSGAYKAIGWNESIPVYAQAPEVIKESGATMVEEWGAGQKMLAAYVQTKSDKDFESAHPEEYANYLKFTKAPYNPYVNAEGGVYIADTPLVPVSTDTPTQNLMDLIDVRRNAPPKGHISSIADFSVAYITDISTAITKSEPATAKKAYALNTAQIAFDAVNEELGASDFLAQARARALYKMRSEINEQVINGTAYTGSGTTAAGVGIKASYTNSEALPNYADAGPTIANLIDQMSNPGDYYFDVAPEGIAWSFTRATWGLIQKLYTNNASPGDINPGTRPLLKGYPVILNGEWDTPSTSGTAASRYSSFGNFKFYTLLLGSGVRLVRIPHPINPHLGARFFVYSLIDGVFHEEDAIAVSGGA